MSFSFDNIFKTASLINMSNCVCQVINMSGFYYMKDTDSYFLQDTNQYENLMVAYVLISLLLCESICYSFYLNKR